MMIMIIIGQVRLAEGKTAVKSPHLLRNIKIVRTLLLQQSSHFRL